MKGLICWLSFSEAKTEEGRWGGEKGKKMELWDRVDHICDLGVNRGNLQG